jgi:RNA polymerase sigma factor (sigma-70 family)
MPNDQPYLPRPGIDERMIVAEMLRDQNSQHWEECRRFVKFCVSANASNIPASSHEDIIQEVMYKVAKSLEQFRFECSFKSWINIVVRRCIIDESRKLRKDENVHSPLTNQSNENDGEGESFVISKAKSAEDVFLTEDQIRTGMAALLEYADIHTHPIRNRLIIELVIDEGKTYAEAAKAAGCKEPVVGYVVREAQLYARKMRDKQ